MRWKWGKIMLYESLVNLYDTLVEDGEKVCPIAHTYITAQIGVLLDKQGNFLIAQDVSDSRELVAVPCTIKSAARTNNVAPHVISDNLSYVGNLPKFKGRYLEYMDQLEEYVGTDIGYDDDYASAVFEYMKKERLYADIKGLVEGKRWTFSTNNINVVFGVYGMENEGTDDSWTDYYVGELEINGLCTITGLPDHIPKTFPGNVMSPSSHAKLFMAGSQIGYIASQKIIHVLQYMIYAKDNAERVEAEYEIQKFLYGGQSREDFCGWVNKKYPGKCDGLLKILGVD